MNYPTRWLIRVLALFWLTSLALMGCQTDATAADAADPLTPTALPDAAAAADVCPVTEPTLATPPPDTAVQGPPQAGYYFVNEDESMWASAWWLKDEAYTLRVSDGGMKVGWFRPEGATLHISGERLDGAAPPLEASIPCCYPTRFQATGLIFPTEGCWQVDATANDSALSFVVWVAP